MKKNFVITAYGKKCFNDIEMTLPCDEAEAIVILNALKSITEESFNEMFDNFRITEVECNRCYYFSGRSTCWAIKGICDMSHIKCDYRYNTLFTRGEVK